MAESRFNGVAILDAVPEAELRTALSLRDVLRDIRDYGKDSPLAVSYYRIATPEDLERALQGLTHAVLEQGLLPWLHLDGHGLDDGSGFLTANGDVVSWKSLMALVTPLNLATRMNVVLVAVTCFGINLVRAIDVTDRAPVLAVISPNREVGAGDSQLDLARFYQCFFETQSMAKAMQVLADSALGGRYGAINSTDFFYDVWRGYIETQHAPKRLKERALDLHRDMMQKIGSNAPSIKECKKQLRLQEEPMFNEFRNYYFAYDLFPDHRDRFRVSLRAARQRPPVMTVYRRARS